MGGWVGIMVPCSGSCPFEGGQEGAEEGSGEAGGVAVKGARNRGGKGEGGGLKPLFRVMPAVLDCDQMTRAGLGHLPGPLYPLPTRPNQPSFAQQHCEVRGTLKVY